MQPQQLKANLEKMFKSTADTEVQKNVCTYLRLLGSKTYKRLISKEEDMIELQAELIIIQKLLDVLSSGKEDSTLIKP